MAASELSAQLWKERELLELLLFKLEEEQLLLIAGKSRWISHATREVSPSSGVSARRRPSASSPPALPTASGPTSSRRT